MKKTRFVYIVKQTVVSILLKIMILVFFLLFSLFSCVYARSFLLVFKLKITTEKSVVLSKEKQFCSFPVHFWSNKCQKWSINMDETNRMNLNFFLIFLFFKYVYGLRTGITYTLNSVEMYFYYYFLSRLACGFHLCPTLI